MDDRLLTARALKGDAQAFDELFEIYFPRLFRFALRRVSDEDIAEEIVQSTLIKAMRSLASWRGEASLSNRLEGGTRAEVRFPAAATVKEEPWVEA